MSATSESPFTSVLLLVLSYGLVLGAPLALRGLRAAPSAATDFVDLQPWMLSVAAAGLGLAGAALMVLVMLKVVRGMEHHPYPAVASALAVLLGVMMLGLGAELRAGSLDASAVCFLCLVTSVLGGGLTQRGHGWTALLGIVVATLPGELVLLSLWSQAGFPSNPLSLLSELSSADRTFLALLTASGVLLSIVAVVTRTLVPAGTSELEEQSNLRERLYAEWILEDPDLVYDAPEQPSDVPEQPSDVPEQPNDSASSKSRERLARAMSLAIADLSRGDGPPALPREHDSAWNFQDTEVEVLPYEEEAVIRPRSQVLVLGSLVVVLTVVVATGWVLARS
ncbi:MAG: hypothetical protein QM778_20735 [Myxococcales bacterium]